jgi:hypothetical protein
VAEYTMEELEDNGFEWRTLPDGRQGFVYNPARDRCLPNPKRWLTNGIGINGLKDMRKVRRYLKERGQ